MNYRFKEGIEIGEDRMEIIMQYIEPFELPTEDINVLEELYIHYEKIYAHGGMNRDQTNEVAKIKESLKSILSLIKGE